MFTTITLQLDIAAIVEAMAAKGIASSASLYAVVARSLAYYIDYLGAQGHETKLARELLFDSPDLYAKYLLSSGSLLSKKHQVQAISTNIMGYPRPTSCC